MFRYDKPNLLSELECCGSTERTTPLKAFACRSQVSDKRAVSTRTMNLVSSCNNETPAAGLPPPAFATTCRQPKTPLPAPVAAFHRPKQTGPPPVYSVPSSILSRNLKEQNLKNSFYLSWSNSFDRNVCQRVYKNLFANHQCLLRCAGAPPHSVRYPEEKELGRTHCTHWRK